MARKVVLCGWLIVAVTVFAGCNNTQQKGRKQTIKPMPGSSEYKKTELTKKIDSKFENPVAHFELGKLYANDGLWDKAEYEYNIALSFDPAYREVQAALVNAYKTTGEQKKAELAAEIYMNEVSASAAESLRLGRAFQDQGLDEYTLQCYMQAMNLAPNSAVIHKQIGYFYLARKEMVRAEEYLRRSFQIDPYQPEVAEQLGKMGVVIQVPRKAANNKKIEKAAGGSKK